MLAAFLFFFSMSTTSGPIRPSELPLEKSSGVDKNVDIFFVIDRGYRWGTPYVDYASILRWSCVDFVLVVIMC